MDIFPHLTDDGIMSFAAQLYSSGILTSINSKTTPIAENAKRQMYKGVENSVLLTANFYQHNIIPEADPWVWVHIINGGPNVAMIATDIIPDIIWVAPGEPWDIDRRGAEQRISILYYRCENPGELANLRVSTQY